MEESKLPPLAESTVHAGFPSPAQDYMSGGIDLNKELVRHPEATFYVRVTGDSMTDAGISDGDVLVVDRSLDPRDGAVAICFLDGEFLVRRLRFLSARSQAASSNSRTGSSFPGSRAGSASLSPGNRPSSDSRSGHFSPDNRSFSDSRSGHISPDNRSFSDSRSGAGSLILDAANPAYSPITVDASSDFSVWGLVTWILKPLA